MSNAVDPTSNDEFSPEPSPDSEVWMKHHPSEHIFKFQISDNNTILEDAYILQQNPLSDIDPAPLAPRAQEAARRYLSRAKTAMTGIGAKGKAGDFVPSPPPSTQPPPGGNMGADNATNRIIQEAEIRRRAFVPSTSTQLGSPRVLLDQPSQVPSSGPASSTKRRRIGGLRARTAVGKAVIKNQVAIALSAESLLVLIDEKLASLQAQLPPNSDEAKFARDQAIAHHEDLRRKLVAFRDATFGFLAGKVKEKSVAESAKRFREKIGEKFLDTGLFLLSVSICAQQA